ncbi:hypothetical protein SNE40_001564 [Patella caerulea]
MAKAVMPGKLLLRNVYRLLQTQKSWSDTLVLDTGTCSDLMWWHCALLSWNGTSIQQRVIEKQMFTDASATAWGGVLGNSQARGLWTPAMSSEHSNVREMMAVLLSLRAFQKEIQNKVVQLLTDNISTVAYINCKGGPSQKLTQVATWIWAECLKNNVTLVAKHLSGKLNFHADFLSRHITSTDWKLHPALFRYIDKMWGPHTIDRCASLVTTQIPTYNSYYSDPECVGIDCLAQSDWGIHNNYVNPPFRILNKVLDVIVAQKACATVIAPKWVTKPWYQRIIQMSISPPIRIPNNSRTFINFGQTPEPLKNPRWHIFAWRISGELA